MQADPCYAHGARLLIQQCQRHASISVPLVRLEDIKIVNKSFFALAALNHVKPDVSGLVAGVLDNGI
ncbi:hypothetical protein D3C76_1831780 [compost metagenome]